MRIFRRVSPPYVLVWVLAVVPALAALSRAAEAQRTWTFGISAGVSSPISDFADVATTGLVAAAALGYNFEIAPAGVRLEGFDNRFGRKAPAPETRIVGFATTLFYNLRRARGAGVRPYVIGGVGFYEYMQEGLPGGMGDFGFNGGGGVKFPLAGLSAFAEARLHSFKVDDPEELHRNRITFVPIVFGIEL